MIQGLLLRGVALAAVVAGVAAFGFWMDASAKAARIHDLEGQVAEQRADAAAMRVIATRAPQIEVRYRNARAAVDAAGERTSDACLNDPRVRAAYATLRLRYPDSAAPAR